MEKPGSPRTSPRNVLPHRAGQRDGKSERVGRGTGKWHFLGVTWLSHSWAHSSCASLHTTCIHVCKERVGGMGGASASEHDHNA